MQRQPRVERQQRWRQRRQYRRQQRHRRRGGHLQRDGELHRRRSPARQLYGLRYGKRVYVVYATLVGPTRPFYSPTPPMQPALVQGKSIAFIFTVASASFHGPGTYPTATLGGLTVGSDEFTTANNATSSVTVSSDGSGMASFANYVEFSGSGQGTESGAVTWTCSG
jgi:hypothetical protein